MTLFVAKIYFNEEASSIVGVFNDIALAKNSIEIHYSKENSLDYIVEEFPMNGVNPENIKAWEYNGNWNSL